MFAGCVPFGTVSVKLAPPTASLMLTNSMSLNVTGFRLPTVIVLPEMVTARPVALRFSVPVPSPPVTVIGVVAEGMTLNVSGRVELGGTSIKADAALSVPSTVTLIGTLPTSLAPAPAATVAVAVPPERRLLVKVRV
jgi:hypothetical protein